MGNNGSQKSKIWFIATLLLAIVLLVASHVKTFAFNSVVHHVTFSGDTLFSDTDGDEDVSVTAVARSSTWGKIFDFDNEGLTESNYQAYTYDFNVVNNTWNDVSSFTFRLNFDQEAFISSAWNGALEIHQQVKGGEHVATVPDMREFDPDAYTLETVTVDGESFITMNPGDYLVYIPSASKNAMEVPIEAGKGTTPGIILYVKLGESIEGSSLELEYRFHRVLKSEPLFWTALGGFALWLIALIIMLITRAQIRQYMERHERDNEIINESIETFTGFIDAKDPYTNGHSKRVATYTRLIAKAMGYSGEELDRIYYIALLHDCGKIGVPDSILTKPGKLTAEEFEIIKSHTVRGGEILSSFKSLENAGEGALYHHERYDGKGYPSGKKGTEIPLIARMICVADSFDAMNTNRVYRKRLSREQVISEIETNKGKQFDPEIADVMLGLLHDGKIQTG